jgi:hypothetical protein
MITIVAGTGAHGAAVAELWNARRLDTASCWYGADAIDETYAGELLAVGFELRIALEDALPVGFGFWCGPVAMPRLVAVCAAADEVYYRLLAAFCEWATALGAEAAYAEIGTAPTTERERMDALGVIAYVPIGFEPLVPGQNPAERVPTVLRAECHLEVLRQAVAAVLESAP